MKPVDFMVLMGCLLVTCFTNMVFAEKGKGLNGHCIHITECKSLGYFCHRNKTCQCAPGFMPNKEWTGCLGFIGSRCTYDNQCIEGAYCTGTQKREVCQCKEQEELFPSEDNRSCISAAWTMQQSPTIVMILAIFWISLYLNT